MGERSSPAVETGTTEKATSAPVPASIRATGVWPSRASRRWRDPLLRRMLACADVVAALVASLSLVIIGVESAQFAWSLVFLPAWVVVAKLLGLYDRDGRVLRHLTVDEAPLLVLWALIGTSCLSILLELTPAGRPEASGAILIGVVAGSLVLVLRASARWLWRTMTPPERVAILGNISNAAALTRKLELFPDTHMAIVSESDILGIEAIEPESLSPESLAHVDRLVFAPASLDEHQIRALREVARAAGVKMSVVPPCRDAFGTEVRLDHLAELPLLEYNTSDLSRSTLLLKRALDVGVSSIALVVLLPLFAVIAGAIKLDSRGPALFRQTRAGRDGNPFRMLKFRTMVADAEALLADLVPLEKLSEPMFKLPNDPRVTRVGRFLRRWSLDEIPQLWNVLRGDMSLVGPRPEQLDLAKRYSSEQRLRLVVKPGLTGPMQVYGRAALRLQERVAVERDYIENLSMGRDIRILAMTVSAVFRGRGAF